MQPGAAKRVAYARHGRPPEHVLFVRDQMENIDTLAEQAELEIGEAKQHCEAKAYDPSSRKMLWDVIQKWTSHPQFDTDFNALEVVVLNELEFTLSNYHMKHEGWKIITELARRWHKEGNMTMMEALRIASFEIAAEPPEYAPTLELLYSLATDPEVRWAVFAAYENFPWRLRPHAKKYSGGAVTDEDCDQWLTSQGLYEDEILMTKARNDVDALKIYIETSVKKP